eukprot:11408651-Prorocentrum_lima.AAC.1
MKLDLALLRVLVVLASSSLSELLDVESASACTIALPRSRTPCRPVRINLRVSCAVSYTHLTLPTICSV